MLHMRKRLGCWARDRKISIDFEEQEKARTYDGLESRILNSSYDDESATSKGDECAMDSLDEDDSSCSSSNIASGSFSSQWTTMRRDDRGADEWELPVSPQYFCEKEKPTYTKDFSDIETMKEKFSKLFLGEDVTGGSKGISSALALSNAITNLAASVFGELWRLEPLSKERKSRWRKEMDWLLSPTNYMVELVPSKQNGPNGLLLEIMTPKARADIRMNLPALQKLDSMIIDVLDSMDNTEFWYSEVGSRAEGRTKSSGQSKRWWLPLPQVPRAGLSDAQRKKLLNQAKLVNQIFKAAKSINESVLLDMPLPTIISDALIKSGKAGLGEELYQVLTTESKTTEEMLSCLSIESEHSALEAMNKLQATTLVWEQRIEGKCNSRSPLRTSCSFIKDSTVELDKTENLLGKVETLLQHLRARYPNLPPTLINVTKIQYGKDVGHSILEAYSRVLGNLAFSILCRIGDVLQEDVLSNPNSPAAMQHVPGTGIRVVTDSPTLVRLRHSLIDRMQSQHVHPCGSNSSGALDIQTEFHEARSSVSLTPRRSRVWCIGKEACTGVSAENSP